MMAKSHRICLRSCKLRTARVYQGDKEMLEDFLHAGVGFGQTPAGHLLICGDQGKPWKDERLDLIVIL